MSKILVIGAGMMATPVVKYLHDRCSYEVILADVDILKAKKISEGKKKVKATRVDVTNVKEIDALTEKADAVISIVPKQLHPFVASSCMKYKKSLFTSSYETPAMLDLHEEALENDLLVLNELGEDPGLDHLLTQFLLDKVKENNGQVVSVKSYGCGIPSFEHNNNPFGYKFSWNPRSLFEASQTPAAYYQDGTRVEILGDQLLSHFHLTEIEGIGVFETYPNRDAAKYLKDFSLSKDISYYRGLLRHPGYCNNMNLLRKLGTFDDITKKDFTNTSYRSWTASMVGCNSTNKIEDGVADYLGIGVNSDFINSINWLGLFDSRPINICYGSNLDVLLELMLEKMSYKPHEKDMILVHSEIINKSVEGGMSKHMATIYLEGTPYGDSAMSRAVGLPVAIGTRLYLEGKITARGALIPPRISGIYKSIFKVMEEEGFNIIYRNKDEIH